MVEIKHYTEDIKSKWDEYVAGSEKSNFFHATQWKPVIEKTFGMRSQYIYAEEDGKIVGVLPLFWVKNIFLKKTLMSVPFGVYGGVCSESIEIEKKILEKAKDATIEQKASYMELRYVEKRDIGFKEKNLYHAFIMELPEDSYTCWTNMRKKARNIIRKGMKAGLEIKEDPDDLEGFYKLFSLSQQNLGTPVLPLSMFFNIMEEYKNDVSIFSTFYKGKKINSLMVFYYKNTVMPYYIGYDRNYLCYSPNNFILWKLIEYSCENKYKYYDLGRSREGSGSFHFKKNMGVEPIPLHYQFFLNLEKDIPNISPSNKKFGIVQNTWQKLPPSFAKALGPKLVRYFP